MFGRTILFYFGLWVVALVTSACGIPVPDPNSATGKAAILDIVNLDLSQGDCPDALTAITPLYNSTNTDNDVRMAMASVYACEAGFNFFNFFTNAENTSFSSSGVLFEFFAKEFPSSGTNIADKVVESAAFGIDALMASLNPNIVLIPGDLFNASTNNPGSMLWTDRTSDSNEYLLFLSMAAMGGLENRVGASSGVPTKSPALPWVTASTTGMVTAAGLNASGCEYASALLNFADAIASISANCPANPPVTNVPCYLASTLNSATALLDSSSVANGTAETFSQAIYDACNYGCKNTVPAGNDLALFNPMGGWQASGCTVTSACDQCPILLRNRDNCTGVVSDQVSCAAAGVINFVNNSAIGWK